MARCSLWASSKAEEDESSLVWCGGGSRRPKRRHFEQGGFGHSFRRPTTLTTNMDVAELKGIEDSRTGGEELRGSWSSWAPMMVRVLVRGLRRWKQRPGWYSRLVKSLKAVDRRAWERHLANDHIPYRSDCLQCIHNATGRPHRKCLHRDCYVLSADTLGPVRVSGVKGERFAVVFTYQFPRQKMIENDKPIPEDELTGWNLDLKVNEDAAVAEELEDVEEYSPDLEPGDVDLFENKSQNLHDLPSATAAKRKEVSDDWWEFL